MSIFIPPQHASGVMGPMRMKQREDDLRRKAREQAILDAEASMNKPVTTVAGGPVPQSSLLSLPSPYLGPPIAPTIKHATAYNALTGQMTSDGSNFTPEEIRMGAGRFPGGIHMQPGTGSGNPFDRIGNAKDENGDVIMAPNQSDPMGSLDSFYAWQQSGMPLGGSQMPPVASKHVPGGPGTNWVTAHPTGVSGAAGPYETPEQAYNRIWGPSPAEPPTVTPPLTDWHTDPNIPHYRPPKPIYDQERNGLYLSTPSPSRFPSASSRMNNLLFRVNGGPAPKGHPTVVGEAGPEVIVPKEDMEVIPNHSLYATDDAARRRRQALRKGDFGAYLNTMLEANVHIPAHG